MQRGKHQAFAATTLGVASLLAAGTSALSHHSIEAMYDRTQTMEFVGVLTGYEPINPHSWYFFDETLADGSVKHWAIEAGAPDQMRRAYLGQFGSGTLETPRGAQYTVQVAPNRAEAASGFLRRLQLPSGKWFNFPPGANP
jgi:hypothetical protein